MIHELREYEIAPRHCNAYLSLLKDVGMPVRGDAYGRLVGAWLVTGALPARFLHIWEYASFEDRSAKRALLAAQARWRDDFLPQAAKLVSAQHLSFLTPQRAGSLEAAASGTAYLLQTQCRLGGMAQHMDELESRGLRELGGFASWRRDLPEPNGAMLISGAAALADWCGSGALATARQAQCLQLTPVALGG